MNDLRKLTVLLFTLFILIFYLIYSNIDVLKRTIVYGYFQTIKQELVDYSYNLKSLTVKNYPVETIVISKSNYIKLQSQVNEIFDNYALSGNAFEGTDKFYNVDFIDDKKVHKGEIKLFGMNPDHYANKSGHSFRAKYNGGKNFGEKVVSYLKPDTRGFGIDFIFNLIYKNEFDGILINYLPLKIYLNNIDYGFYYKEDFFDKYLIEDNERRDDVIFKILNNDSLHFNHIPDESTNFKQFIDLNPDSLFSLKNYENIDLDKVSALIAIAITAGTNHSLIDFNLRWFHNSVSNLLEPIIREIDLIPFTDDNLIFENFYSSDLTPKDINIENIIKYAVSNNNFLKSIYEENTSQLNKSIIENLKLITKIFVNNEFKNYEQMSAFINLNPTNNQLNKNIELVKNNLKILESYIENIEVNNSIRKKFISFNGDIIIDKDLLLNNSEIVFEKNSRIILKNNADIICNNCDVKFNGDKDKMIYVKADDRTNSSIFFKNSNIILNYTSFSKLSNLEKSFWKLPAAITFYKSNVIISNSKFENNLKGDDFLNFYSCKEVTIEDSYFNNIYADAVDSDFSNISISNTIFEKINNDAVDVSGSKLNIINSNFQNINDKALSIGERSLTYSLNNKFSNSEMAMVVKDGSELKDSISIYENNKLDLVMFIKKKYFGPGKIKSFSVNYDSNLIDINVPLENIDIDNIIINYKENIEELLYGNIYGKASD